MPYLLGYTFVLDSKVTTIERRAFTIMDSFSTVGGFMGLLFLLVHSIIKKI